MPLHDWTRVSREAFHDFHNGWIIELRNALNTGVLPDGYFARSEAEVFIGREDGEGRDRRVPDVGVTSEPADGGGPATMTRPESGTRLRLSDAGRRLKRVAVYREEGPLVAAVEIASPSNLISRRRRDELAAKCVALLRGGAGVSVVDAFKAAGRRPAVEELIVGAFEVEGSGDPSAVRGEDQGLASAYCADAVEADVTADFHPMTVGESLPETPLFIGRDRFVPLPLEETYGRNFAGIAPRDRRSLSAPPAAG